MKKIILFLILTLSSCCYSGKDIILKDTEFRAKNKYLVYEDDNSIAGKYLRGALQKRGIKVLKYARNDTLNINKKENNNEIDINIGNKSYFKKTPYIIELRSSTRNNIACIIPYKGETNVYDIFVEITNLETHEVVLSIKMHGFDKKCGYCEGEVFNKMADEIAAFWNKQ
ncbi:MAG: hypothetical protein BWY78_00462 [Alphaproteobacteria bacterium ADurb.Bin438]|nr:MAG: hypothetical protein BWY78_00462 [Alphaproteobacteria bacterium ADurb.Bin438]